MLPSQAEPKIFVYDDDESPSDIDDFLSQSDTLDELELTNDFTGASEPLTSQAVVSCWCAEPIINGADIGYCVFNLGDCSKSCPMVNCARNKK